MTNEALKHISEAEVVQEVKAVIKATGIKLQRINTGCFKTGDRFIIECKRPVGGRLSDAQKLRIDDINAKGGVAIVAHSGNEAIEQLKARGCV